MPFLDELGIVEAEVPAPPPSKEKIPFDGRAGDIIHEIAAEEGRSEATNADVFIALFGEENFPRFRESEDHGEYAKKWYRNIPHMNSPRFASFLIGSRELIKIISKINDISLLLLPTVDTAMADRNGKKIYLPRSAFIAASYANTSFKSDWTGDLGAAMVATANGLIIHESMHLLKSPPDMLAMWRTFMNSKEPLAEKYKAAIPPGSMVLPSALASFMNITEDFFIEAETKVEFPGYTEFVMAAHEFYFNSKEFLDRTRVFSEAIFVKDGTELAIAFLNWLIVLKNWRFLEREAWGKLAEPFVARFKEAQSSTSVAHRVQLAVECFEMLFGEEVKILDKLSTTTGSPGIDSEGRERSATGRPKGDAIKPPEKMGMSDEDEVGEESKDDEGPDSRYDIAKAPTEDTARVARLNKKLERDALSLEEQLKRKTKTDEVRPVVVREVKSAANQDMILPNFEHLGNKLKYSWTSNAVPGSPQKRGPRLVNQRLSRIITDGKIFAYREPRKAIGRDYEFCILIDSSGSMGGSKIYQAAKAGYTAWRSLRIAGVPTTLLAHTGVSENYSYEEPVVYVIASLNERRFDVVQKRAAAFVSGGIPLQNNYDGYAILKAAEIGFSDVKGRKRYLFVISDGEPSGAGYGGEYAVKHTQRCVESVRMKNVNVISITVDRGAYKANDYIYGKSQNVHASGSNALDELIEALFVRRA
jgi:hypothetical protein